MGLQKRLRAAQRNNYALETGKRPFSKTPLGAGQLRARARLMAQRAANDLRINGPRLNMVESIGNVASQIVEKVKRVRKTKAEVTAVVEAAEVAAAIAEANEAVLEKKPRRVGTRKKVAEGV